jgi:hypothetical protein
MHQKLDIRESLMDIMNFDNAAGEPLTNCMEFVYIEHFKWYETRMIHKATDRSPCGNSKDRAGSASPARDRNMAIKCLQLQNCE